LEGEGAESYTANMSWQISPHFSLRSGVGYVFASGADTWDWRLNMNATF